MGYLLMFKINNLANQTSHIVTEQKGIFSIVEHNVDFSVAPCNAMEEYYMSQMNVKRKQAIANLNGKVGLVLQAGAMQYIVGNVQATTGLKGVGDFLGKMVKSSVTKESAIKPEYVGTGVLVTKLFTILPKKSPTPFNPVVACTLPTMYGCARDRTHL